MPNKLDLPNVGSQKGSTRDAIIAILSREWPLSAKELYNRVKRENTGSAVSYQAVHKMIKQLLGQQMRSGKEDKPEPKSDEPTESIKVAVGGEPK